MLGHRDLTMEDYAGIVKRRFWLILASAVALLGVGLGVSYVSPHQYVSQTLVLIEQQKVPTDYVTPVVTEDLGERLASIREQILSRSRIQPIIERFNLFAGGQNTMDDRVEMTQKAIGVKPIPAAQASRGMPGFFITFKGPDARTAQQVCGEITSLFVSANLSAREQSAEGTTEFLKQQLADAKRNLDDQDAKFAAFQEKYFGKLPEQEGSNTNKLQALTSQLDAYTQGLNRLQQEETFIETSISQQTHDLQSSQPAEVAALDEHHKELKTLKEQKQNLETFYTPDHPDMVTINRRIADLEAQIAYDSAKPETTPGATEVKSADPPELQKLKLQLRTVQQSIADAKQEQARIAQEIRTYESRIESTPKVEEEYKEITRDHETALAFYNSLLRKMNESSMATALEQRQQGEQFTVIDPPNLPDAPSFPNRPIFAGGGFAGGLFLGLLIAGLLEYRDTSLRNERDIWAFTKMPTLAIISHVDGIPETKPTGRRWKLFSRVAKPIESAGS